MFGHDYWGSSYWGESYWGPVGEAASAALTSEPPTVSMRSGFRVKPEDLVLDPYDRIWVHRSEVDDVNPQEFVRGRKDRQRVRRGFPEPDDHFLSTNDVTRESL